MSPGQETNPAHSMDIEQNKHLCPHKACVMILIQVFHVTIWLHWLPSFACLL